MKPDEQQKQWLKEYLRKVLKYHETYEEVYDHILLALETRPQYDFFETAVNAIIADDFGGNNGLFLMEKKCRDTVVTEVKKRYWQYFFSCFKFPYVIYTTVIAILLAYIMMHVNNGVVFLSEKVWIFSAVMAPIIMYASRRFKLGFKLDVPKRLLKDKILNALVSKPFRLLLFYYIYLNVSFHDELGIHQIELDFWKYMSPLIFVAVTIHLFSSIKLINGELKVSMLR